MKLCPSCSAEIGDDAIVCPQCGRDWKTGASPSTGTTDDVWRFAWYGLIVLVVIYLGWCAAKVQDVMH